MQDIYSQEPSQKPQPVDTSSDDSQDSSDAISFLRKLTSFVIGLLIILLIGGGVFYFVNSRSTKSQKSTANDSKGTVTQTVTQVQATPKPSDKKTQPTTPLGTLTQPTVANGKTYKDTVFFYQIKIPQNWETFKRAGDASRGYQIAITPVGSTDVPITLSSQPNQTGETVDQWINDQFGPNYPRQALKIGTLNAILVKASGYNSYFLVHNGTVYQISGSTVRADYYSIFQQILPTFQFTN